MPNCASSPRRSCIRFMTGWTTSSKMSCRSPRNSNVPILQAERDPVVGLGGRVHIRTPVSLWRMSMVAASLPIQSRHLSSNARDGQSLKRPHQARIGATKSRAALNFNSPGGMNPVRLAVSQKNFVSAGFTNRTR